MFATKSAHRFLLVSLGSLDRFFELGSQKLALTVLTLLHQFEFYLVGAIHKGALPKLKLVSDLLINRSVWQQDLLNPVTLLVKLITYQVTLLH